MSFWPPKLLHLLAHSARVASAAGREALTHNDLAGWMHLTNTASLLRLM